MNILILAPHPFFQNRGTPIAVKMLAETLAAADHRLTVLTYPEGEEIFIPNCELLRLPALSWAQNVKPGFSWKKVVYDVLLYRRLKKLLRRRSFDLIHAVEESAFIAAFFSSRFGIPFIYDMDSSIPHQLCEKWSFLRPLLPFFRFFEKRAVQASTGIIPVCRAIEDIAREYDSGILCQRLEDVSLLPPPDSSAVPEYAQLNCESDTITCMYVGNLEKYQGIDLLLKAFALAAAEEERLRLVIIGGSDEDIALYRQKCADLGVNEKIRFLGRRPVADLHLYLTQADILVSPRCRGINTPMKIYSYLDSGAAVLATAMLTHTQVLDRDIACLVEATPEAMAEGLRLLSADGSLRRRLAAQAKDRVRREHSMESFRKKLNSFYSRIEEKIQGGR